MCSISRDPRCQEYTICTAVAPDAVFTVRTYGTRQLYGPFSVQIQLRRTGNPQVTAVASAQNPNREPTQVRASHHSSGK